MRNETLIQFFHWYYPTEGNLWIHTKEQAEKLRSLGITYAWLPPAYKSAKGATEPGYAVYDLYDLGEFDQKGTVRTKHGTRQEYQEAINTLHACDIKVLADIIFNHRIGADEKEEITFQRVIDEDRNKFAQEPITAEIETRFTFPGRNGKYSDYVWDHQSFSGICVEGQPCLIHHEHSEGNWNQVISEEHGNFDFLMGNDVEFRNPAVRNELKKWGCWYVESTQVDGFRLDALKHISIDFVPEWLNHLKISLNREFFCIGECWRNDKAMLLKYLESTGNSVKLFDVPLHYTFHKASQKRKDFDLCKIFNDALLLERPESSITFIDNHDTQPLQALESFVEPWFKPIAYAFILLREAGIPCVFYADLYDVSYTDIKDGEEVRVELQKVPGIETLLKVRKDLAYGPQRDYFDHCNIVGWTREGLDEFPDSGIAVLVSNGDYGFKDMSLGRRHANKTFVDCYGSIKLEVTLNENGEGTFYVGAGSISVWINKNYNT